MTHRVDNPGPRQYTLEQRHNAIAALLAGESVDDTADILGIHRGTLNVWWTDGKRGKGPCAKVYQRLAGRAVVDLGKLKIVDILRRYITGEMMRLRDSDPENVREKLATALYELDVAEDGVVTLSRAQADAVYSLLLDRVITAPEMVIDHHMGRLAMAALMLKP